MLCHEWTHEFACGHFDRRSLEHCEAYYNAEECVLERVNARASSCCGECPHCPGCSECRGSDYSYLEDDDYP